MTQDKLTIALEALERIGKARMGAPFTDGYKNSIDRRDIAREALAQITALPADGAGVEPAVAWEWRVIGEKDWTLQRTFPNREGNRTNIERRALYAALSKPDDGAVALRAARALHRRRVEGQHPKPDNHPWGALSRREQALFRADAHAVLTALREPSEAMETAVDKLADESGAQYDIGPDEIWRTMIDAALSEEG